MMKSRCSWSIMASWRPSQRRTSEQERRRARHEPLDYWSPAAARTEEEPKKKRLHHWSAPLLTRRRESPCRDRDRDRDRTSVLWRSFPRDSGPRKSRTEPACLPFEVLSFHAGSGLPPPPRFPLPQLALSLSLSWTRTRTRRDIATRRRIDGGGLLGSAAASVRPRTLHRAAFTRGPSMACRARLGSPRLSTRNSPAS